MSNIRGPRASKRKILASIVHSHILYESLAWHKVFDMKLVRLHRKMTIKVCRAYRIISTEGAGNSTHRSSNYIKKREIYRCFKPNSQHQSDDQMAGDVEQWDLWMLDV